MIDFIRAVLPVHYGLRADAITQVQGGWSAAAFVVRVDKGMYFAKVYDKHRPSVQSWIARMPHYMPAVRWLSENTPLRDRMAAPMNTIAGDYKVENNDAILLLYPFIDGETLCKAGLSAEQIRQLADTLALLHSYGKDIPVPIDAITETYALPFMERLSPVSAAKQLPPIIAPAIDAHVPAIRSAMERLRRLADDMRRNPPAYALCHTDVHGWNLLWNGSLILIDWEGLQLAPVEADLFTFTDGFFYAEASEAFLAAYRKTHPDYAVNQTAMCFYRLRRRLEDIAEFIHSMLHDDLTPSELEKNGMHLYKECTVLERMASENC